MNAKRQKHAEAVSTRTVPARRRRTRQCDRAVVQLCCAALVCFASLSKAATVDAPIVNGDPITQPSGERKFRVQGEFRPTQESARDSALRTAQERLRDWLARQDPPINRAPSLDQIRRGMNLRDVQTHEEQISNDKMYKITLDVEITPGQVRNLYGRERIALGMWTLGGLMGILGVVALLFRLDEWTKGYLTWWLMIAGAGAVVALVLSWWWAK